MNLMLQALREHALQRPQAIAIESAGTALSYAVLETEVLVLAARLQQAGVRSLGLYADNGAPWAVADLAALCAGIRCVPLPRFFSDTQLRHAIRDSGLDAVLADDDRIAGLLPASPSQPLGVAGGTLHMLQLQPASEPAIDPATQKITYTSGTTGEPKGVCLAADDLLQVAASMAEAGSAQADDRHLAVLPLSTLLENLAGLYAPLLAGARTCLPPQAEVGMIGAAGLDVARMLQAFHHYRASTAILVPQLLHALVAALEAGAPRPPQLRYLAVGGAPLSPRLLLRARKLGLPAYEGYGLSECASVVALNTPLADRPGSAGQPLPHLRARLADDGEIEVRGAGYRGYVGGPRVQPGDWIATGDLGRYDEAGFLHITGRKKSMFVTAFGRNVAPEWVERELTLHPVIAQAAVFGEGRPWNAALIVPRPLPGIDVATAVAGAIAAVNAELPDYARVRHHLLSTEPFTPANGLITPNGRLRRDALWARHGDAIEHLYRDLSQEYA